MGKRCIVCDEIAKYMIKDSSDYYCEECAQENFADLNLLIKVEEEAQQLKKILEKKEGLDETGEKSEDAEGAVEEADRNEREEQEAEGKPQTEE